MKKEFLITLVYAMLLTACNFGVKPVSEEPVLNPDSSPTEEQNPTSFDDGVQPTLTIEPILLTPEILTPSVELETNEPEPKPTFEGSSLSPTPEEPTPMTKTPVPGESNALVQKAKRDLAARLNIEIAAIDLVRFDEVTWRNGSLGCPQPGMAYTQALVNGSLIVLRAGGVQYEYHSGGGMDPFYCANPEPALPPDAGGYGDT